MGFYDVIPLFVDTNLGTHFALSISQDITAGELKGKLVMEHFSCFPNLGKIKVHGLMVKKKSFFYHLSDSIAIKHVFEELSGTWFLYLNASSMQNALEDGSSVPFAFKLALSNSSPHGDNPIQKTVSLNVADYRRLSPISTDGDEFFQFDVSPTRNNAQFALSEQQAEMRFLNTSCRKNVKKRNIIKHNNPVEANKLANNSQVKSTFGINFNTEHQSKHDCCQAFQNDRSTVSEHPIIESKMHESSSILENYTKSSQTMENYTKSSQTISVTGIISRFFSELDEVDSFYCQPKHIHETVQVRIDELRDSNIRTLASLPDHISNRKTVEFDTDTQCSLTRKQEKNAAERAKVALKVKMQQLGSKKLVSKKSPLCTSHISSRMYIETLSSKSCKYRVGKRLVQAASSIQISGNGNKFLSKCKSYDSAVFDRRIAYDVDDFVD